MTVLDWICSAILVFFCYTGYRRGLIGEFFRIIAVLAGMIAGFKFYERAACFAAENFSIPVNTLIKVLFFVIIFAAASGIILAVSFIVKKIIRLTILGWVDRLGGVLIGALKGMLLIGFCLWLIILVPSLRSMVRLDGTIVAGKATDTVKTLWGWAREEAGGGTMPLRDSAKKMQEKFEAVRDLQKAADVLMPDSGIKNISEKLPGKDLIDSLIRKHEKEKKENETQPDDEAASDSTTAPDSGEARTMR